MQPGVDPNTGVMMQPQEDAIYGGFDDGQVKPAYCAAILPHSRFRTNSVVALSSPSLARTEPTSTTRFVDWFAPGLSDCPIGASQLQHEYQRRVGPAGRWWTSKTPTGTSNSCSVCRVFPPLLRSRRWGTLRHRLGFEWEQRWAAQPRDVKSSPPLDQAPVPLATTGRVR